VSGVLSELVTVVAGGSAALVAITGVVVLATKGAIAAAVSRCAAGSFGFGTRVASRSGLSGCPDRGQYSQHPRDLLPNIIEAGQPLAGAFVHVRTAPDLDHDGAYP
jgi:hypothetical protein